VAPRSTADAAAGNRVHEPVPGLVEGIQPKEPIADWRVVDQMKTEPDGTRVIETRIGLPDGSTGVFEQAYNPATQRLDMRRAFGDQLPRWVNASGPPLVNGRGTPTGTYFTLRQQKLLGIAPGQVKTVELSKVQSVRAVAEFNVLLQEGVAPEAAVMQTHSIEYAGTSLTQNGLQITGARVGLRRRTPFDVMLEHYEKLHRSDGSRDPVRIAEHDKLIEQYGKGKIHRNTPVEWDYDVEVSVSPFSGSSIPGSSPPGAKP
jgi:hypothetical protein